MGIEKVLNNNNNNNNFKQEMAKDVTTFHSVVLVSFLLLLNF